MSEGTEGRKITYLFTTLALGVALIVSTIWPSTSEADESQLKKYPPAMRKMFAPASPSPTATPSPEK